MWLFLIFVAVPIIEIALFIQLGGYLGLWKTLAIVILTALIGTILVRLQGISVINDLQTKATGGGNPLGPLAHGFLVLVSGILLLTPGFFTDAVGFAFLVPAVRTAFLTWAGPKIMARIRKRNARRKAERQASTAANDATSPLETTYEVKDPAPDDGPRGDSGWTKPR